MNSFKVGISVGVVALTPIYESPLPQTLVKDASAHCHALELCSNNDISISSISDGFQNESYKPNEAHDEFHN
ncbi:hypothetical protein E2542_SST02031 [Spatholobus suberectus]|nr:hypothetical protein E2542_SST02031 [Spatholobus suberectus]